MASIDRNELTQDMIQKAMACKDADELLALAKAEGYEMTKEEAEAYLEELSDFELDDEALRTAAGGIKTCYMIDGCAYKCGTLKDC